ncbi:MAG: TIGR03013 family PEP-CTERM/XrtA system glycosyltransferase [Burkholderiales bacterium]|nr:TIGR03013 family PEP-CTERM/XrtA system glycosyltransferase [Burkholderiales bacterium]
MIPIFSHYVPGRLIFLAGLEALVLVLAAYVGISLNLSDPGAEIARGWLSMPPQAIVFVVGMLALMTSMGLYQPGISDNTPSTGTRLAGAFVLGFLLTGVVSYLVPELHMGTYQLGGALVVALLGTGIVRVAFIRWSNLGWFKSRVLVLGTGSRVMRLAEFAKRNPNHVVVGYVALRPTKHYIPLPHVLPVAPGETLLSIAKQHEVDEIVIAVRDRRGGGFPVQQLLECRLQGVKVTELATFFEREYRQMLLESINPSWMVLGEGFRQGWTRRVVKRLFDLAASLGLLAIALPVMVVTALLIVLESAGPVLYRQERVGAGGGRFTLYKFRSMRNDAEEDGRPRWAAADDDRTTRVGRVIRKLRIDELPQIINVLKGDMSFVGPRPERPFFVDQLTSQIPYYALRHSVKPGITGWAQVQYPYGASVDDAIEKLQYDLYYVKNHCLFLDLMILIDTVQVVLWGKGAR